MTTPKKGEVRGRPAAGLTYTSGQTYFPGLFLAQQLFRHYCGIATVMDIEFLVNAFQVTFYCFGRNEKLCGNLLVLQALGEQFQDIPFTIRQLLQDRNLAACDGEGLFSSATCPWYRTL